jgi:hypothetical protein
MDWSDLLLRVIRAAGALTSALAGIADLLTDGAFPKRARPPTGWYKDLPFSDYEMTRKGGILLTVILLAPLVQFVGDWIKDANDAKAQRSIAQDIRNDVAKTVKAASEVQLATEERAIDQENGIGKQASDLLGKVDKSLILGQDQTFRSARISTDLNRSLNPLTNVLVTYWITVPIDAPELAEYRTRLTSGIDLFLRSTWSTEDHKPNTEVFVSESAGEVPTAVDILMGSSLMPRKDEGIPYYLLRHSGLNFSIFRVHHAPARLTSIDDQQERPVPDLASR